MCEVLSEPRRDAVASVNSRKRISLDFLIGERAANVILS
jgi:hypothetical protein